MNQTIEEKNKALVLKAFDTLFNKRDYAAAEGYWSPHYIQHSNHIEPGREGLFNLIKSLPPTLKYEAGVIVAGGDFVMVLGRDSGRGHAGTVKERLAHVRRQVSAMTQVNCYQRKSHCVTGID